MIYSKRQNCNVPVQITKENYSLRCFGEFTRYNVKDKNFPIGYVDLKDTKDGVRVEFIKNNYPQFYKGFGKIADQIEVEHCLARNLDSFEITSEAALNSHALHYKRGKRFKPDSINETVKNIIKNTPIGENYHTEFLNRVQMYMPKEMITRIIENVKKHPLLK